MDILIIVGVVVVLAFVFMMVALLMLKAFYFKVEQGKALIINGVSKIAVRFDGGFVWPIINKKELMRISLITLEVDRRGKEGLIARIICVRTLLLHFICESMKPKKTC